MPFTNEIETKLTLLLDSAHDGKANISEALIDEFGERCKYILRKQFNVPPEDKFRLRMSNIGRRVRQLVLEKIYGRSRPQPEFKLVCVYGDLVEALMLTLLKASDNNVTDIGKKTILKLGEDIIEGEIDLKIDGGLVDIKSASNTSYSSKFKNFDALREDDPFGYIVQLYGYAEAEGTYAKGWLVVNKSSGEYRFIEATEEHQPKAIARIKDTITKVNENYLPPCTNIEKELWRNMETGNLILGKDCKFCTHKDKCHPNISFEPCVFSKAKNPEFKWYISLVNRVTPIREKKEKIKKEKIKQKKSS